MAQRCLHAWSRCFVAQWKKLLAVEAVEALWVHGPAFLAWEDVNAPKAKAHARLRDLPNALLEGGLVGPHRTAMVGRSLKADDVAGGPDQKLPTCRRLVDELTPTTKPHSFRRTISCDISLSRERLATIHFSRPFSSSSCFSRHISDGMRPG